MRLNLSHIWKMIVAADKIIIKKVVIATIIIIVHTYHIQIHFSSVLCI